MDFYRILEKRAANNSKNREAGHVEVYPDFIVGRSKDLMIRGHSFYAVWDEEQNTWLTDEMEVIRLVDQDLWKHANKLIDKGQTVSVKTMSSDESGVWKKYVNFIKNMPDNFKPLDNKIMFQNDNITRASRSSHHLPYNLEEGECKAYDRLMSVLYSPEERDKLEWAIGSILCGDSKHIQKFIVMYGESGSGKSTFLNILQKLIEGYYISFNAKALANSSAQFSTEVFKTNPLVAIQHDGDLSKIEDNSTLNSIISHEPIVINEKHKAQYAMAVQCFLFMGTNRPVKITDSQSGIIRRLIDVTPSGQKVSGSEYKRLVREIDFELGAIANHCLKKYAEMGEDYYDDYRPEKMLYETNAIYNFVQENFLVFRGMDFVKLSQAYDMYKQFCLEAGVQHPLNRQTFLGDFRVYFQDYKAQYQTEAGHFYHVFLNIKEDMFEKVAKPKEKKKPEKSWLEFKSDKSLFDSQYADAPAQLTNSIGNPMQAWDNCHTTLRDISTSELHFLRLPENHIVIDFDLKNEKGEKDYEKNLLAASKWPSTYAELSKSGAGIHLHYIYDGDVNRLSRIYEEDIEIKVFAGKASLRRKLTKCNDIPIMHISSGLPEKKGEKMLSSKTIENEMHIRRLIEKGLNKEVHAGTKPNCDFIFKILDDAYKSEMSYDVTDMRSRVLAFAMQSTNQATYCVDLVNKMKFTSENTSETEVSPDEFVFYDVEVFKNLFLICYKIAGPDNEVVSLVNPTSQDVEKLFKFKLIGFNNRRYDDHILYARYLGYTNEQLYNLSSKMITKQDSLAHGFREAYNISFTDIYDFSSTKQSLKKWEIDLGIHHQEFEFDFNEALPEEYWPKAIEYCCNDVIATETLFYARKADFLAREILADLAGGKPNNTTNQLTTRIVFGNVKNPELVYTHLEETFPGYEFVRGADNKMHNMYRGTDVGFGGYVYAEPGMYHNVALIDVASMHPTSIIAMNYFGEYTKNYQDLLNARIAIKHGDLETARTMLGGKLAPYLEDESKIEDLAYALKIALNSAYGLTSASFINAMRDTRNVNNIIALRGALFMRTLQDEVQARGFTVVHIKTDSIKIADATPEIIEFCKEFAKQYQYTFEHEATYEKMCLVNNAVYIAKYGWAEKAKLIGKWTATGAQFAEPYLFKKLFSKEEVVFNDYVQTKSVTAPAAMYLDFNENLPEDEHNYRHVGKVGAFVPVLEGTGGGILLREKNDKYDAVTGTKGYRWKEAEIVKGLNQLEDVIDISYYRKQLDDAVEAIRKYGDVETFLDDYDDPEAPYPEEMYPIGFEDIPHPPAVAHATIKKGA